MDRYYSWKRDLILPHAGPRVVEVGCGAGSLLLKLTGRERLVGAELDAESADYSAARLRHRPEVEIRRLDVLDPGFLELAALRPTSVVFGSSLEVIEDPAHALRQAAAVLEPAGRVVIFTAALPWLTGTLDAMYRQRRYRRADLLEMCRRAGLAIATARYVNLAGLFDWWWRSRVLKQAALPPKAFATADVFVPLARALDLVTGPPVGRTLFVVADKA